MKQYIVLIAGYWHGTFDGSKAAAEWALERCQDMETGEDLDFNIFELYDLDDTIG